MPSELNLLRQSTKSAIQLYIREHTEEKMNVIAKIYIIIIKNIYVFIFSGIKRTIMSLSIISIFLTIFLNGIIHSINSFQRNTSFFLI